MEKLWKKHSQFFLSRIFCCASDAHYASALFFSHGRCSEAAALRGAALSADGRSAYVFRALLILRFIFSLTSNCDKQRVNRHYSAGSGGVAFVPSAIYQFLILPMSPPMPTKTGTSTSTRMVATARPKTMVMAIGMRN